MPKPRQLAKPNKKSKAAAVPESADDFQALADEEESRGGKWRAGDTAKSARAFERAIAFYDQGLQHHPGNFDLAYNKARLQLELSQRPALLPQWGLSHGEFLTATLESHRQALRINDDDLDLLFNTAQVLTSLAEALSQHDRESQAIPLLHEALEILSTCLAKQEMLLEQQSVDFDDDDGDDDDREEDGGVALNAQTSSVQKTEAEESAIVIQPILPTDLLDTVHAALSALTTLISLENESGLENLQSMARTLYDTKNTAYLALISDEQRADAQFTASLDRAVFVCALANARFSARELELQTLLDDLESFNIPDKQQHAAALSAEAEARAEAVLSILEQTDLSNTPVAICWKQLSIAQDVLTQASKLNDDEAKDIRAEVYKRKGDLELGRVRLASLKSPSVTQTMRGSRAALLKNAQTFYKAAISHATSPDTADEEILEVASQRAQAVEMLIQAEQGVAPEQQNMYEVWTELVDEGLIDASVVEKLSAMSI